MSSSTLGKNKLSIGHITNVNSAANTTGVISYLNTNFTTEYPVGTLVFVNESNGNSNGLYIHLTTGQWEKVNTSTASTQTIVETGAVDPSNTLIKLDASSATFGITLAAPNSSQIGNTLIIQMTTDPSGNSCLLTPLTNIERTGGFGLATAVEWNAEDEVLVLLGIDGKWLIMKEHGVTFS